MKIQEYKTKSGETRYGFQVYIGVDPQTGNKKTTRRSGFKSQKSAQLAMSRLKLEIDKQGTIEKDNNVLFSTVYHEWYEQYINTVRESTYARTDSMFQNHILPAFGNKRIRTITIGQVQRAVNKWFKNTKVNYMKWYHYTVNVFEFAIKRGYMTGTNPAKMITMPRKQANYGDEAENFWSKEELIQFFDCLDQNEQPELFALFRLLAFAGLRRGEVLALTWNDLNITERTLRINKTLTQGMKGKQIIQAPKTRKSRRTIILDQQTVNVLKHWRTAQKRKYMLLGFNTMHKEQLIFANTKNHHKILNWPSSRLHKIIERNALKPITVHGFRHTHASALFASGATTKEVQERLGHEDVQTTLNIYTHVTKHQNEQAVNKLVNYLDF